MSSLIVFISAAALSMTAPLVEESVVQPVDSLYIESEKSGREGLTVSTDTLPLSTVDTAPADILHQQGLTPGDSLLKGGHRARGLKKNLTSVKNSKEQSMPEMTDPNPLLTNILLYDPDMYRVYPSEPRFIDFEDIYSYLKPQTLFRPLVFGAIQPDLRLNKALRPVLDKTLMSSYTESLVRDWYYKAIASKAENDYMMALESANLHQIVYDVKDMPRPEQLVFTLHQEKPLIIDKAMPYSFGREEKKTGYLPGLTYNPWSTRGNYKLHFSETYVSPNWSRGGESNMAGLASIYLEANYNNLKGVQFDNNVELKIGMNTVPSDTLRNLNVSTDQLRAVSKLGIRMKKDWYYSLSSEFTTQVLNNYKKNTMSLKSSFLSPARLFVSLGVDYKKSNNKKGYNLSVLLSPATYKMNYLYDNVNLNPASYGIESGKHFGSEIGSKVSSTLNWRFSERLNWKSKIYYFTDYTYVDSEWENTLDIMLNHYFSTQIFVHLKLDDRLQRQTGESLLQMQQLLSFGMTYYF